MAPNAKLAELSEAGVAVWLDDLKAEVEPGRPVGLAFVVEGDRREDLAISAERQPGLVQAITR
jgi:hypothetical protein